MNGDCKHGKGKYQWSNGTVYEGYYHMDAKHGEGELHTVDPEDISKSRMHKRTVKFNYGVEEG